MNLRSSCVGGSCPLGRLCHVRSSRSLATRQRLLRSGLQQLSLPVGTRLPNHVPDRRTDDHGAHDGLRNANGQRNGMPRRAAANQLYRLQQCAGNTAGQLPIYRHGSPDAHAHHQLYRLQTGDGDPDSAIHRHDSRNPHADRQLHGLQAGHGNADPTIHGDGARDAHAHDQLHGLQAGHGNANPAVYGNGSRNADAESERDRLQAGHGNADPAIHGNGALHRNATRHPRGLPNGSRNRDADGLRGPRALGRCTRPELPTGLCSRLPRYKRIAGSDRCLCLRVRSSWPAGGTGKAAIVHQTIAGPHAYRIAAFSRNDAGCRRS